MLETIDYKSQHKQNLRLTLLAKEMQWRAPATRKLNSSESKTTANREIDHLLWLAYLLLATDNLGPAAPGLFLEGEA